MKNKNNSTAKHEKKGAIAIIAKNLKYVILGLAIIAAILALIFGESKIIVGETQTMSLTFGQLNYQNVGTGEYFYTLDDALADAYTQSTNGEGNENNKTIRVLNDRTETTPITISANNEITLDLNGKVLEFNITELQNGTGTITNNGTFTLIDSSCTELNPAGNGILSSNEMLFLNSSSGDLNITSGTVKSDGTVISSLGNLVIGDNTGDSKNVASDATPVIIGANGIVIGAAQGAGNEEKEFKFFDGIIKATNTTLDTDDVTEKTEGYYFVTDENEVIESVTYHTAYLDNEYEITADANGGTIPATQGWTVAQGNETATKDVRYNAAYGTLPTSEKTGYTFSGWQVVDNMISTNVDDWEQGGIHYDNGENTVSTNQNNSKRLRLKEFLPVSPSTNYVMRADNEEGIVIRYIYYYNANKEFISVAATNMTQEIEFTTPSTCEYIKTVLNYEDIEQVIGLNKLADANLTLTAQISATTKVKFPQDHTIKAIWTANTYTVTFDANGGTVDTATKNVTFAEAYGELPTPTREGYTFQGWNGKNIVNINENADYRYQGTQYTYNQQENSITFTPTTSGYQFIEYYLPTLKANTTYTLSGDIDYDAQYSNRFVRVYDIQGSPSGGSWLLSRMHGVGHFSYTFTIGENDETTPALLLYGNQGETPTEGAYIKYCNLILTEGTSTGNYEPHYISETTTVVQSQNHTLTAEWQINSHTLTINPNGGTYNGTTQNTVATQNYGTTYNIANNATKEGYVFGGWQLTSGNGDVDYLNGAVVKKQRIINSLSSAQPEVYNNNHNGVISFENILDETSETGYSMKIVTDGSASPGAGGFRNGVNSVSGSMYIHKIVAKIPTGYNIRALTNATGVGYKWYWLTSTAGTGEWETYIYVQCSGYNGPFTDLGYVCIQGSNNQDVTWYLQESTIYQKGNNLSELQATNTIFTFLDSDATMTAIWNASGAGLTFDTQGGTLSSGRAGYAILSYNTSYNENKKVPYQIDGTDFDIYKEGYTLDGWYTAATGGTKLFDKNGKLVPNVSGYSDADYTWLYYTNSFTIYAHWISNTCTVTADANGGTIPATTGWTVAQGNETATKSVTYNSQYGELPTPTRSGYSFDGWYDSSNNEVTSSTIVTQTQAHTLTAQWTQVIGRYVDIGTGILDLENDTLEDGTHPSADWRILNQDSNGTWLILADYMPNTAFDVEDVGLEKGTGNYAQYGVCSSTNRQTLIDGLKGTIADEDDWTGLLTNSSLLDSNDNLIDSNIKVQGTVDIETWVTSWNANTGYTQLTLTTDSAGYMINNAYSVSIDSSIGWNNTLYFPHKSPININGDTNQVFGYISASPSACNDECVVRIDCAGGMDYNHYSGVSHGIRPALYLPNSIKLDTSGEIWKIADVLLLDNQSATTVGTEEVYFTHNIETYYSDEAKTTTISSITIPTKTGYTFGGYYTEPNGQGTQYITENGEFTGNPYTLKGIKRLYAHWVELKITVTINKDDVAWADSGMKIDLSTSDVSNTATFTETVSTGSVAEFSGLTNGTTYYIYAGKHDADKTNMVNTGLTAVTGDSVDVDYYTIDRNQGAGTTLVTSFDSSSGSAFSVTRQVLKDVTIYARASIDSGYSGTATLMHGNTSMTASGDTFVVSDAETITSAGATANTYYIVLNTNYSSTTNTNSELQRNQTMRYGTPAKLPANTFTNFGYVFKEWNTEPDGSGTSYADEEEVNNLTTVNNATVKLYAQWKIPPIKYAVQIYGINQDVDANDQTLGLTFGPATGENVADKYITHTYRDNNDGTYTLVQQIYTVGNDTPAESDLNVTRTSAQIEQYGKKIHDMSWTEIAAEPNKEVFTDSMLCGDTKSVEMNLNDTIKRANYSIQTMSGDGCGILFGQIAPEFGNWNASANNDRTNYGYKGSRIRSTLIGYVSGETSGYAGTCLTETNCLYSCIESDVQDVITAKKIKYVTGKSATSFQAKSDISDKIWLFSAREIMGTGSNCGNNAEGLGSSGVGYAKFTNLDSKYYISSYNNSASSLRMSHYSLNDNGGNYLLRSINLTNDKYVGSNYGQGSVSVFGQTYNSNGGSGIAFGFCIK